MENIKKEIEFHPNKNRASLHINKELPNYSLFLSSLYEDIDENFKPLLKSLLNIKGITDIDFSKYEISIGKGLVFNWDSIIDEVSKVVDNFFNGNIEIVHKTIVENVKQNAKSFIDANVWDSEDRSGCKKDFVSLSK